MPKKIPSNQLKSVMLAKLFNLGSIIFVLALLGLWLDKRFNTLPLYTIIGIILGLLYSFFEAWRIYKE